MIEKAAVFCNRRFSPLLVGGDCVIPQRSEPGPWDFGLKNKARHPGAVTKQAGDFIVFRGGFTRRKVHSALYIGTRAPDNYYHWLINALPSLHLLNLAKMISKSTPVIVPGIIRTKRQLREALAVVADGRPLLYIEPDEFLDVRFLYCLDLPPVYDTPLSMRSASRGPLGAHIGALSSFREHILQRISISSPPLREDNVFILRPDGDPRGQNQSELFAAAKELGYAGIRPEQYSFAEQVQIFASAKHFTGATGAAFTNLLFSSGASALIYRERCNPNENFFELLGSVGRGEVECIDAVTTTTGPTHIDAGEFYQRLRQMTRERG